MAKASKPQVKRPRPTLNRTLPRGITLLPLEEGQPRPYGIQWIVAGKRTSEFFATLEQLDTKAGQLIDAKKKDALSLVPTPSEVSEWRAFRAAAGSTPTHEVLAGWKNWVDSTTRKVSTLKVSGAVKDYLTLQEERLNNKPQPLIKRCTYTQKVCKLERFSDRFGDRLMSSVTGVEIKQWAVKELPELLELEEPSRDFIEDHIRKVSELYRHYAAEVPLDPTSKIELGADLREKPDAIPALHIAELLLYALEHHKHAICRLACEVFVGVRASTVSRLTREDFKLQKGEEGLRIRKRAIKTETSHFITTMPPVFWDWIRAGWDDPEAFRPDTPSDWMHVKSRLVAAVIAVKAESGSPFTIPRNALRHAFPSYHVAVNESADKTALVMCHEDATMLWQIYMGKASKEAGEWLFSLTPQNIKRMVKERRAHESRRAAAGIPTR